MLENLIKPDQTELQTVIFTLGCEEYAIPVNSVQEIILPQKITRIPKSPEYILGFINLRGNIIPVTDCRKKFETKTNPDNLESDIRIMIVETETEVCGLLVDNVKESAILKTSEIESLPVETEECADIFPGIGKYNNKPIILVDPEKFIAAESKNICISELPALDENLKTVG